MIYPENFEHKIGFAPIRQRVAGLCASALGAARCGAMTFSADAELVGARLRQTAEMLSITASDEDLPLAGLHDPRETLTALRILGSFAPADELLRLRRTIAAMEAIKHRGRADADGNSPYPALAPMFEALPELPGIASAIDKILDQYGNVKDSASPELAELRRSIAAATASIGSTMRRVMSRAAEAGYLEPDATPAMREGRLMIPVSPMHKRKINGIVHDQSASGKTIFIEPAEIVEANNRIRELRMDEHREIVRILTAVASDIRPHIDEIESGLEIAGELDFIHAKAAFAADTGGTLPEISDRQEMEWFHACHPGLLLSLRNQGKEIVPLDITLTDDARLLIISGPNAGGKSVTLKTVGIIQYMAQCGMLPTLYENSRMGIFADIMIDIGDDQSLENDLSTYSSHLRNMKQFLASGRASSLILIDEFGGGTEPQIGGAIAQAILRRFNDNDMWGVITTHYQNLKHFAEDTPGLINGSMLYDRGRMQPLFRLAIGNPGSSFAVEIARKIGLPEAIIADAEEIVGSDYVNMDKYLLDIARDRRYWENKRTAIRQKEKKLEQLTARYEQDADTLRQKRREIIEDARAEARRIIEGSNASVERTIHEIRRAQADKEATLEARRRLKEDKEKIAGSADATAADDHPLLRKAPKAKKKKAAASAQRDNQPAVEKDMNVRLDGQGVVGRVIELDGKNAVVAFGMLKMTVPTARLTPTIAKVDTGAGKASFVSASTADASRERQLNFRSEIDVRGMRADEAIQAVTYFIDDAIQFNAGRVRILHGTGTGALRQSLRTYLATVAGIDSFHDEDVRFGGAGITVVNLN